MSTRDVGSATALIAAATTLVPMIRALADELEAARQLPPALVEALVAAGLGLDGRRRPVLQRPWPGGAEGGRRLRDAGRGPGQHQRDDEQIAERVADWMK